MTKLSNQFHAREASSFDKQIDPVRSNSKLLDFFNLIHCKSGPYYKNKESGNQGVEKIDLNELPSFRVYVASEVFYTSCGLKASPGPGPVAEAAGLVLLRSFRVLLMIVS